MHCWLFVKFLWGFLFYFLTNYINVSNFNFQLTSCTLRQVNKFLSYYLQTTWDLWIDLDSKGSILGSVQDSVPSFRRQLLFVDRNNNSWIISVCLTADWLLGNSKLKECGLNHWVMDRLIQTKIHKRFIKLRIEKKSNLDICSQYSTLSWTSVSFTC